MTWFDVALFAIVALVFGLAVAVIGAVLVVVAYLACR